MYLLHPKSIYFGILNLIRDGKVANGSTDEGKGG